MLQMMKDHKKQQFHNIIAKVNANAVKIWQTDKRIAHNGKED